MARYRYRFPCSECGSIRVRCVLTGATDNDQPLRLRQCEDCGHRFTTIETEVVGYSIYQLDSDRKWRNRMRMRALRGYHGTRGGAREKRTPRVDVKVRVTERAA